LKADSLADLELQHLGVGAALLKESKTSNDPVVQIDEFLFAEVLNINVHGATLSLRFHATAAGRTDLKSNLLLYRNTPSTPCSAILCGQLLGDENRDVNVKALFGLLPPFSGNRLPDSRHDFSAWTSCVVANNRCFHVNC
jgi:hypothetical protein